MLLLYLIRIIFKACMSWATFEVAERKLASFGVPFTQSPYPRVRDAPPRVFSLLLVSTNFS